MAPEGEGQLLLHQSLVVLGQSFTKHKDVNIAAVVACAARDGPENAGSRDGIPLADSLDTRSNGIDAKPVKRRIIAHDTPVSNYARKQDFSIPLPPSESRRTRDMNSRLARAHSSARTLPLAKSATSSDTCGNMFSSAEFAIILAPTS